MEIFGKTLGIIKIFNNIMSAIYKNRQESHLPAYQGSY